MNTKHVAEVLADVLEDADQYLTVDIENSDYEMICEAVPLLRTIPSLEAEIVSLKNKVFELEEKLFSSEIIDIDSDRSKLIIELAKSIEKNDLSFFKKMMKRGKHETI